MINVYVFCLLQNTSSHHLVIMDHLATSVSGSQTSSHPILANALETGVKNTSQYSYASETEMYNTLMSLNLLQTNSMQNLDLKSGSHAKSKSRSKNSSYNAGASTSMAASSTPLLGFSPSSGLMNAQAYSTQDYTQWLASTLNIGGQNSLELASRLLQTSPYTLNEQAALLAYQENLRKQPTSVALSSACSISDITAKHKNINNNNSSANNNNNTTSNNSISNSQSRVKSPCSSTSSSSPSTSSTSHTAKVSSVQEHKSSLAEVVTQSCHGGTANNAGHSSKEDGVVTFSKKDLITNCISDAARYADCLNNVHNLIDILTTQYNFFR